MSLRRVLAAAAIPLAAGLVLAGGAAAAPSSAPAAPTPATAWVGRVLAPVVARRAPRVGAPRAAVVKPVAPFAHGPTVLLITRTAVVDGRRWVEVLLPKRPNGTRGWLPADVLRMRSTAMRITIDLSDRRLTVLRGGRRIIRAPIAVGQAATPTPTGSFAIAETVRTGLPGAFLGPFVFPLTGFSETLNEYAGGNGRVAIHGTSQPALIGTAASHGCIRMLNRDVVRLSRIIRPGTPVIIRS